jgi:hypothetical protein
MADGCLNTKGKLSTVQMDGADVQIREQKPQGLGRNEVGLGE